MVYSIFLGAIIPFFIGFVTFLLIRKIAAGDPLRMMKANVVGFFLRIVFYGVSVGLVMIKTETLNRIAFVIAFVSVFILLHLAEALYFNRLFLYRKSNQSHL